MQEVVQRLGEIGSRVRAYLDAEDAAREEALRLSRELNRRAASAIRAVHRAEWDEADRTLQEAAQVAAQLRDLWAAHGWVYMAGFVQDAQKEYAEAQITRALIGGQPLPTPEELGVEPVAYLNGLAESTGELRRHIVDAIRQDALDHGEGLLQVMDEVYNLLVTFDYPDAISMGLKRRLDVVRGVLERTRSDLTNAIRQEALRAALARAEGMMASAEGSGTP
jgi:translin